MNTRGVSNKKSQLTEGMSPVNANNHGAAIQQIERKLNEVSTFVTEQLKAMEERIMQRFSSIAADITNLRADCKLLTSKVSELNKRADNMSYDIDKLKSAVNILENEKIAGDFIVYNLPNDIEAESAASKIVTALSIPDLHIRNAFRTKSINSPNKTKPLIVKLQSSNDRVKLFRALAEFKKTNKRQLRFSDIGLSGDTNIQLHECLSNLNRELLNNAIRLKKSQLLSSVFTLRGNVYVKKNAESTAIKVMEMSKLNSIIGNF